MTPRFDSYRETYGNVVEDSIRFSGMKHDFFLKAKADVLNRILSERGANASGVRALDVGCGIGSLHHHLLGTFASLDGCDISSESISRASHDNPWATYRSYQAGRLPYEDASFDLVFASCVVHHVPPADRPGFFAEMRRVLRFGGLAVVIEHNPYNPLTQLAVYRCPFDDDAFLIGARSVAKLMRAAALRDPRSEYILLSPVRTEMAQRLERALSIMPLGAQYACSAVA
jgi:ubiquinone/menaquinone biosynthesis C-methylase UbiE